jgi:predicted DNA-binding transcriptional regulator
MATTKAQLLDLLLREKIGDGLLGYIATMRDHGRPYREIAQHITEITGHPVTHESVRVWHTYGGVAA